MKDLRNIMDIDAPRCRGGYLEDLPDGILDNPDYALEVKEDGIRVTMQIGETRSLLIGRNRQDFLKGVQKAGPFRDLSNQNPPISEVRNEWLDGTVLDGELTELFKKNGEYGKDTKRRKKMGLFTGYTAWSVLVYRGQDVRHMADEDRFRLTRAIVKKLDNEKIRLIRRFPCTTGNLEKVFMAGFEGGVAKKRDARLLIHQRTQTTWWKLKGSNKRTVDVFVVGATAASEGGSGLTGVKPKPNGKAACFLVAMVGIGGNIVEVGKMTNLPANAKERGLRDFNPFRYRVVEMIVSGWDGAVFRWPRFKKWRPDKSPSDCLLEEQL